MDPPSTPSLFKTSKLAKKIKFKKIDVRNFIDLKKIIIDTEPDFIFHLAAQSLVKTAYDKPLETVSTNLLGTLNILEALKSIKKKIVAILITSDKVYENVEWLWGYKETDNLGGKDLYSSSKPMTELGIKSYFDSYFKGKMLNLKLVLLELAMLLVEEIGLRID